MAHPLTKDDLDQINAALAGVKQIREVIRRAKVANIDVSLQESQVDEGEARLKAIKLGFFPQGRV